MATTSYGSPYVASTDLVSGWPAASLTVANRIDDVAIKGNGINAITSAGYTLVLTDAGKLVTVSNASAQNLTIPLNASVAFPTGTKIDVLNVGAGTWTLVATGGVTLTGSTSIPTSARVRLTKTGTDTWYANTLGGGGGLTFITSGTVSAGSAININNCFTSTYEHYRLVLTTNVVTQMRLRVSGADNSSANYYQQSMSASSTTLTGLRTSTATQFDVYGAGSAGVSIVDVFSPAVATPTYMYAAVANQPTTNISVANYAYTHNVSSAFDGFSLLGTTMTATVRVYGYSNS